MDRAKKERDLILAERNVTLGLQHIARQVEIVAACQRDGRAAQAALGLELLEKLRLSQAEHEAHRDRLFNQLRQTN